MILSRAVPILTASNLRSSTEGYCRRFGLDLLMDHGCIVTLGMTGRSAQFNLMERDETALMNPIASLQVDDVDQALETSLLLGSRLCMN